MEKFIQKVKEMRAAQVSYFATRKPGVLIRAKMLEKEVDEMLETLLLQQ